MKRQKNTDLELSTRVLRCIDILFQEENREQTRAMLRDCCVRPVELERVRLAALKYSDGDLARLKSALELAKADWRDLLMATGFASDVEAHLKWEPMPSAEPSKVNSERLAQGIHMQLATVLLPLGFERRNEEWRREGEVPQSLCLLQGLISRIEARFFLRSTLEAKPLSVVRHLPRVPSEIALTGEQGYIFRDGHSEEAFYASIARDVAQETEWFDRFTTVSQVRVGFEEDLFSPNLSLKDQVLMF